MAFVYVLRCADRTLYVGSTTDLDARVAMHNDGRGGGFTSKRLPVVLVFAEEHATMQSAARRERQIKRWTAVKKEALIAGDIPALKRASVSRASPRYRRSLR